jgi:hypothetical protein
MRGRLHAVPTTPSCESGADGRSWSAARALALTQKGLADQATRQEAYAEHQQLSWHITR